MMISDAIKRTVDVVVALIGLILFAPVLLICAAAVIAVSPGRILYSQDRVGRSGRLFRLYKLRTMYADADRKLASVLMNDPEAATEWQCFGRLANDPRIIPTVGHILRRTSLDELPQLWNVLLGDMSLVGPRPLEPWLAVEFDGSARDARHAIRPGLTGWWQVQGRGDVDLPAMRRLDLEYLARRSLVLDAVILLKTPSAILSRRGAY